MKKECIHCSFFSKEFQSKSCVKCEKGKLKYYIDDVASRLTVRAQPHFPIFSPDHSHIAVGAIFFLLADHHSDGAVFII